ncbi:MAG: hypothetical protein AB7T06_09040 [Kofleriaceae bacterium]
MLRSSLLVASLFTTTLAAADDMSVSAKAPPPPAHLSLTLPQGAVAASVAAQSNISDGGASVSLAPDLALGVTDTFTVALVHSTQNATGFWSGASTGSLCVAGDGCANVYSGGALLAKLALVERPRLALAALGGVIATVAPDTRFGLGAGVEALVDLGRAQLHFKPTIYIGLDDRDDAMAPNTEFVNAPISLYVPATRTLRFGVQTGVAAPVDHLADAYRIPAGVMGQVALSPAMSAQLAFNLDRVAGGEAMPAASATDARSLMLTLGWVK